MRYGYFDDERREYVITQPDTPLPWINYLGSQAYFGLISNTAGGYSFYQDARLRRLTRYRYNNVPFDHRLKPAWGFSCLIQGVGKTILFDTGGSGSRLTANMERLGLDPGAIEIVFVSHDHADHTGGLKDILERNRNVDVFLGKRMKILDDP